MKRITIIALLLLSPSAFATKYYVNNGTLYGSAGNDANNGTSLATAWLTCRKACSTVVAGDTVLIRGGTYDETSAITGANTPCGNVVEAGIVPLQSGDSATGRRIVFKGYPGDIRPIMVGHDQSTPPLRAALVLNRGEHHITYDSIHFHKGVNGIIFRGQNVAHHITIRNCIIDSTLGGCDDNNGGVTFYGSGYNSVTPQGPAQRNNIVEGCEIFHNGQYGHGYIDLNESGIHSYCCDSCIFRNNYIHDQYAGIELKYSTRFTEIYGNTFANCFTSMWDVHHGAGGESYPISGPDRVLSSWHHNISYNATICFSLGQGSENTGIAGHYDSLLYFYNNTCDCSGGGSGIVGRYGWYTRTYFFNNIFYNPTNASTVVCDDGSVGAYSSGLCYGPPHYLYDDYNMYYTTTGNNSTWKWFGYGTSTYTLPEWRAATLSGPVLGGVDNGYYGSATTGAQGDNSVVANPLFVNAPAHDYHLQPGSPALSGGKGGTFTFKPGYTNASRTVTLDTYFGALGDAGQSSTGDLSIGDVTVTEGGSAVFSVTLSAAQASNLSFSYATSAGTATGGTSCTAGVDYVSAIGTRTITTGQTSTTITVPTCDDATVEAQEQFYVVISSPSISTVVISDNTGQCNLNDNDLAPSPGNKRIEVKGKVRLAGKVRAGSKP